MPAACFGRVIPSVKYPLADIRLSSPSPTLYPFPYSACLHISSMHSDNEQHSISCHKPQPRDTSKQCAMCMQCCPASGIEATVISLVAIAAAGWWCSAAFAIEDMASTILASSKGSIKSQHQQAPAMFEESLQTGRIIMADT